MNRIESTIKNNYIPLIFAILGCELIFYSLYGGFSFLYSGLILILVTIFFAFYDMVNEQGKKGPMLYTPVLLAILIVGSVLAKSTGMIEEFNIARLVFGGEIKESGNFIYASSILTIVTFLYSSMIYYFSVIITRVVILILLYFIPLILYARGVYKADSTFIYLFLVSLFFILIIEIKNSTLNKKNKMNINDKHMIFTGGVVILIILAIAIIMPKPKSFPKIGVLDGIKDYVQNYTQSNLKGFSVEWGNSRNVNESTTNGEDVVLYTFTGNNPEYFIVKNYDVFQDGIWKEENEDFFYGSSISNSGEIYPIDITLVAIGEYNGDNEVIKKVKNAKLTERQEVYVSNKFDTKFGIHPSKTQSCKLSTGEDVYLSGFDMLFLKDGKTFQSGNRYALNYIKDNPDLGSKEAILLAYLNDERYLDLLKECVTSEVYETKKENLETLNKNYTKLSDDTSDKLINLSKNLTNGEESTYSKAKAIESYFRSGSYVYSLTLPKNTGKESYIDYFIFEGKTGFCVQYATAMTLLCRASGIPARYVEGYVVDEEDRNAGTYEVNAKKGHAFVEVYIAGYGWKIFDPTPGIVEVSNEIVNEEGEGGTRKIINSNNSSSYIIILIALLALLSVLVVYLTDRKRKLNKLLKLSNEEALEGIIADIILLLKNCNLTPKDGETLMRFSTRVDEELNINFKNIIQKYYDYKYAFKNLSKEDVNEALKLDNEVYKYIKEIKNNKKK